MPGKWSLEINAEQLIHPCWYDSVRIFTHNQTALRGVLVCVRQAAAQLKNIFCVGFPRQRDTHSSPRV
ncbi:MAG: hypothetical protein WBY84_18845, partial [Pseudolabrys sp.]